mgnify:FL=1
MKLIIPNRFKNINYGTDVPINIKNKAETLVSSKKGIYLYGPAGCGKTHIAYAIASFFNESKYKTWFLNTGEMLRQMREEFEKSEAESKESLYRQLINFDGLLFFDDIGAEKASDWVRETFYLILNDKYENMIPVIFTSNYSLDELAEKMGDRVVSRIMGICDILKLEGRDRRLEMGVVV